MSRGYRFCATMANNIKMLRSAWRFGGEQLSGIGPKLHRRIPVRLSAADYMLHIVRKQAR